MQVGSLTIDFAAVGAAISNLYTLLVFVFSSLVLIGGCTRTVLLIEAFGALEVVYLT